MPQDKELCAGDIKVYDKIGMLKITYTVKLGPKAINRDYCDKNHQSGALKHWDTQIISQPGGVIPTF